MKKMQNKKHKEKRQKKRNRNIVKRQKKEIGKPSKSTRTSRQRRPANLIFGVLIRRELLPPSLQSRFQPELHAVEREISSAAKSWSSGAPSAKSDDLDLAGATGNRHTINGKFVEKKT
jgi:hypothetical protein